MSLPPPRARKLFRSAGDWADGIVVDHPGEVSADVERFVRRFLLPMVNLCHRPTLTGIEHLPRDQPFLLVANHSAGTAVAEVLSFVAIYLRDVGAGRRLAGFALPLCFRAPPACRCWSFAVATTKPCGQSGNSTPWISAAVPAS